MKVISSVFSFAAGAETTYGLLTQELTKAADRGKEDMQTTTVHFETVAPNFTTTVLNPTTVEVGPEDTFGGQIWFYLDQGTLVRYATMTKDPVYNSKTSPNTLRTHSNNPGKMAYVNTRRPRPGIKARGWTSWIASFRGKQFQRRMTKAMLSEQRLSFSARGRDEDVAKGFRRFGRRNI